MRNNVEQVETVIIGGGQAGLSVGYHLARRGRPFVVLDAGDRIGDSWRKRWNSLRLFTPARFSSLNGSPFPAPTWSFPSRDEMGDYLEAYAARFALPVRTGTKVEGVRARDGGGYVVMAGSARFEAENVVVATGTYQKPRIPSFASQLDSRIVQLHSSRYVEPGQLAEGGVLVVGAGNSGADIALEAARDGHPTWMSGRDVGQIPFRIGSTVSRLGLARLVLRVLFHRVLTVRTPMGRKLRPKIVSQGGPLIRAKAADFVAAGIERVPRVEGIRDGLPVLADGRVLDVANVVWCTGFVHDFSWIELPVFERPIEAGGDSPRHDEPRHRGGIVTDQPGLYFVGLHFLYSLSSAMIHGVGRDAERIAKHITARATSPRERATAQDELLGTP
jgi:putative flavoprotein involved in K+ transport